MAVVILTIHRMQNAKGLMSYYYYYYCYYVIRAVFSLLYTPEGPGPNHWGHFALGRLLIFVIIHFQTNYLLLRNESRIPGNEQTIINHILLQS